MWTSRTPSYQRTVRGAVRFGVCLLAVGIGFGVTTAAWARDRQGARPSLAERVQRAKTQTVEAKLKLLEENNEKILQRIEEIMAEVKIAQVRSGQRRFQEIVINPITKKQECQ